MHPVVRMISEVIAALEARAANAVVDKGFARDVCSVCVRDFQRIPGLQVIQA